MASELDLKLAKLQFGSSARLKLYRKLAKYLRNGVPIYDALSEMSDEMLARRRNHPVGLILREWGESMRQWGRFSSAVEGWLPPNECVVLSAGEASGDLPTALDQACFLLDAKRKMIGSIMGGLVYNCVLLCMLTGMMYLFGGKVIPQIEEILPIEKWPPLSQDLRAISKFVYNYLLWIVVVVAGLGAWVAWSVPNWTHPVRYRVLDHLPPWSLYKVMQAAGFLVSLSAVMRSGRPFYEALLSIAQHSSDYLRRFIEKMVRRLSEGSQKGLGACFEVGLLGMDEEIDLKLMSRFSDFEDVIHALGVSVVEESMETIKKRMAIVGFVLLFSIALYIGFSYYAIYLVTDALGGQAGAGV